MSDLNQSCILLLDLPQQSLGGIDLLSFQTTPQFQGIKNLPQGWHFAFASTTASLSVRYGAWFWVGDAGTETCPELHIKKWDAEKEDLIAETSEAELCSWANEIGSVWHDRLTPYRQSAVQEAAGEQEKRDWALLCDSISSAMLKRVIPEGAINHWVLSSASSAKRDEDLIPGLTGTEGRNAYEHEKELHFLPIDLKQTWREGATGRERTNAARDRSWALRELIANICSNNDEMEILGEMQFCFLMVLTLNNYSCLEQWKRILGLLFTCKEAITERPTLFLRAIPTLRLQLQHSNDVEGGLFDLSDGGANLLKGLLKRFRKGLDELEGRAKSDIMDELDELELFLKEEYGWEFEGSILRRGMLELEDGEQVEMDFGGEDEEFEETGDYAPTVVELTTAQRKEFFGDDGEDKAKDSDSDDDHDTDDEDLDQRY